LSKGYARGIVDKTLFIRKHESDAILVQVDVDVMKDYLVFF